MEIGDLGAQRYRGEERMNEMKTVYHAEGIGGVGTVTVENDNPTVRDVLLALGEKLSSVARVTVNDLEVSLDSPAAGVVRYYKTQKKS